MEADNDDYDEMDEAMYAMNDNNIDFDMFPSGKYSVHNHLFVPLSKMPQKMPKKMSQTMLSNPLVILSYASTVFFFKISYVNYVEMFRIMFGQNLSAQCVL